MSGASVQGGEWGWRAHRAPGEQQRCSCAAASKRLPVRQPLPLGSRLPLQCPLCRARAQRRVAHSPPPPACRTYEAFERRYAGDHSWEGLQEDEQGRLRPVVRMGPRPRARGACRRSRCHAGLLGGHACGAGTLHVRMHALHMQARAAGPRAPSPLAPRCAPCRTRLQSCARGGSASWRPRSRRASARA